MARIVADSSADLLELEGADFVSVAMNISTNERTFTDDSLLDVNEMLDYMEKYNGRSFTSCPGTQAWLDAFGEADVIYVVCLTSALSGTYNSARTAADIYLEDHPDAKIHVFDSLTTGPEMRLLVERIAELDKKGVSFEEVIEQAEEYVKTTGVFFSFKTLHNLAQNGRVGKVAAAAVGVLGLRIVGTGSEEGKLEMLAKRKGDNHAAAEIFHQLEERGFLGGKIRICHADNEELAKKYERQFKKRWPDVDFLAYPARGLVSYYAERGGIIVGAELI
ncbi:MAG: DegV family EDD domain-containing protein [Lachnospiraceae bacterium]|nr:DegV family EDD domain-containing protein [Lachnospiraceae bacterium]